jgi:D-cysteine desulfhydrase
VKDRPAPEPPRLRLCHLPTPVVHLPRLSRVLGGPRLFMKRDDLTGLGLGGNKTRKLEFLLGDAVAQGCDTVVTGGAMQSNHCRQTAAAAAAAGLRCHLALAGAAPEVAEGNLLLDLLFGAVVHWCGGHARGEDIPSIADEIRRAGGRPYVIPFGGSNAVGALGFVAAMEELAEQERTIGEAMDVIVLPSASAGTQAGAVVGADHHGVTRAIFGIAIDRPDPGHPPYEDELAALANGLAARLGSARRYGADDFQVRYGYFGGGYAVVGDREREAIRLVAASEGIVLDPVYTGRAMGALVDLVRRGTFRPTDAVLFWHTGGIPALFAHARDFAATGGSAG